MTEKHFGKFSGKAICDIKFISFNEYINLCRRNKFEAAKYKSDIENEIIRYIWHLPEFDKVKIKFTWVEDSRRRDLDNICYAKKFILDALVKAGKIPTDGQKHVKGFTDDFRTGESAKVIVEIEEVKA